VIGVLRTTPGGGGRGGGTYAVEHGGWVLVWGFGRHGGDVMVVEFGCVVYFGGVGLLVVYMR